MDNLLARILYICGSSIQDSVIAYNELTLILYKEKLLEVCDILKNHAEFKFSQLIDLCGVDYLHYGQDEWETTNATYSGFSRAVIKKDLENKTASLQLNRFAVVYHLLSLEHNMRIRLKVFLDEDAESLHVPSVISIWDNANWYEREAFDLFGIIFDGHPDLRRILTDYGFTGHPLRKDFPLIGNVEVKYDEKEKRVLYQPVSIQARTLVPKVIRKAKEL